MNTSIESEKKEKILIVEDSKTQAMLLKHHLKTEGYTVEVAENGIIALDIINNEALFSPDIIISDINMPEMNGLQLCRQVKKTHPEIFIVMLTANNDIESLKESFESGAVDFINKPLNEVEMLIRIRNIARIRMAENNLKTTLKQLANNNRKLELLSITDSLTGLYGIESN
jgi:PleD family two-component response regulator